MHCALAIMRKAYGELREYSAHLYELHAAPCWQQCDQLRINGRFEGDELLKYTLGAAPPAHLSKKDLFLRQKYFNGLLANDASDRTQRQQPRKQRTDKSFRL